MLRRHFSPLSNQKGWVCNILRHIACLGLVWIWNERGFSSGRALSTEQKQNYSLYWSLKRVRNASTKSRRGR